MSRAGALRLSTSEDGVWRNSATGSAKGYSLDPIQVLVESGQNKAFAGAAHWPGWRRSGRDEADVLQTLVDHAPRYARVLRIEGNARTDSGPRRAPRRRILPHVL